MNASRIGDESKLERIRITCKTCGVSEYFYSNLSLDRFKLKHVGHEIDEGTQQGGPQDSRAVMPGPKDERQFEGRTGTRLSRLVVDLVVFPALPDPLFRIRGFTNGPEPAFIVTSTSRANTRLQEFLDTGYYVDYGYSNLPFVWEPEAVEYEQEVRVKLGLPAKSATEPRAAAPKPGPREDVRDSDGSTVARSNELLLGLSRNGEAIQTDAGRPPVPQPVTHVPQENPESPALPPPPQSTQEQEAGQQRLKAPTPRPPLPLMPEEKGAFERAPDVALSRPEEEEDGDYLLVSKSWYIQGGTKNKSEAVRISKVLRAFRWRVEPLYTIAVILDDVLSIETSKNQIGRELIRSIENAGYRLTAVTMDLGKLVAWFKKASADMPATPDSEFVA